MLFENLYYLIRHLVKGSDNKGSWRVWRIKPVRRKVHTRAKLPQISASQDKSGMKSVKNPRSLLVSKVSSLAIGIKFRKIEGKMCNLQTRSRLGQS